MRRTDRIRHDLEHLTALLPAALARLAWQADQHDTLKSATTEPRVSGGGSTLTKVEAAANQRTRATDQRDYIIGLIAAAERGLELAVNECRKTIGQNPNTPRCTGGAGREGAIEWGRPDCWEVPARGALCIACYTREYRWRNQTGLPTRAEP